MMHLLYERQRYREMMNKMMSERVEVMGFQFLGSIYPLGEMRLSYSVTMMLRLKCVHDHEALSSLSLSLG